MPSPALSAALGRLARAADPDPPADGRLVARFARTRDPDAFAELVRRLGPMVLGVCRRVTGDAHLADDAFQAAFLVLARRAADVKPAEAVRAWLYGVAVRVAREARAVSARRRAREAPVAVLPDRAADLREPPDADALRALDEEVAALPDHLRAAVVLCELDGASRKDAAARLGVPEGTVSSRLAKGRRLLADRLRKRGVTAAGLAALAPAVVPARLAAAASALSSGPAPAAVATLANGVLPIMDGRRLSLVPRVAGLVAVAVLAAPPPDRPAAVPTAPAPRPAALLPKGPNQLFFCWGDTFFRCDPDGKNGRPVRHSACPKPHPDWSSLSPDGTKVAFVPDPPDRRRGFQLLVFAADGTGPATDLGDGLAAPDFIWSGDGARLYVTTAVPGGGAPPSADTGHAVVELASGRRTPLALPRDDVVTDWSRDGERFLASRPAGGKGHDQECRRLVVLARDGTPLQEVRPPADRHADGGRFSPDGRRVLYAARPRPGAAGRDELMVFDLDSGRSTPVAGVPPAGRVYGCCWSPDGRRIAYTWHPDLAEPKPGDFDPNQKIECQVVVCDADGRNRSVVTTNRSTAGTWSLGAIDWR